MRALITTLLLASCLTLTAATPAYHEVRAIRTKTKIIPAPSGFIPFRTSLPGTTCDRNCGTNPLSKRSANIELAGPEAIEKRAATTTTLYAACATNNIGDRYNRRPTINVQGITGDDQNNSAAEVASPYDCCVFAFTRPFPVALWQFAQGTCITYNVAGGAQVDNTYAVNYGPLEFQSVFGNGPNGEVIKGQKGDF